MDFKANTDRENFAIGCIFLLLVFLAFLLFPSRQTADSNRRIDTAPTNVSTTPLVVKILVPAIFRASGATGSTNLPDGMELQASLRPIPPYCEPQCGYVWMANVKVKDGTFEMGPFNVPENTYRLEITSSIAELQPAAVRSVIGLFGENLQGVRVQSELIPGTGPIINYQANVGVNTSAQLPDTSEDQADLPQFSKSETYPNVRRQLLEQGWTPITMPNSDTCNEDDRCNNYPEMAYCSGNGMAPCLFTWKREDVSIGVTTIGESPQTFSGIRHCTSGESC